MQLLDRDRNIKIADFGMAALEAADKLLETSCGSPHYASPEIVAGLNYHGSSSDIWSCGIILFALLTGRLPFDDENIRTLLAKVKVGKYTMPSDVPPLAKELIRGMLVVDPEKRMTVRAQYFSLVDVRAEGRPWACRWSKSRLILGSPAALRVRNRTSTLPLHLIRLPSPSDGGISSTPTRFPTSAHFGPVQVRRRSSRP